MQSTLTKLIDGWENTARAQFECAGRSEEDIGKRVMEHGAVVYTNCSRELKAALSELLLLQLASLSER